MESSSSRYSNGVQPSSKHASCRVHCLQQVLLAIIFMIGFLAHQRLTLFGFCSIILLALTELTVIIFSSNHLPVLQGTWVSMGVYSDGSYGIPAGLIYSFPVTCANGQWSIVQGMLSRSILITKCRSLSSKWVPVGAKGTHPAWTLVACEMCLLEAGLILCV